jgi:hypothetical protein
MGLKGKAPGTTKSVGRASGPASRPRKAGAEARPTAQGTYNPHQFAITTETLPNWLVVFTPGNLRSWKP